MATPIEPTRGPDLVLPFALFGAAAGWLSIRFLANPLVDVIRGGDPRAASLAAGVTCAAAGMTLTRWRAEQHRHERERRRWLDGRYDLVSDPALAMKSRQHPRAFIWMLLSAVLFAVGAVTGALFGALEIQELWAVQSGAVTGALAGLAFVPVAAMVLGAAMRAERARRGSVVSGVDRRAVWGILCTVLGLLTLGATIDWAPARAGQMSPPWLAFAIACATAAAILAILAADVRAIRRVARAARAASVEVDDPSEAEDRARIDLGLGDELRVEIVDPGGSYRTVPIRRTFLLGSPNQATDALRHVIAFDVIGVLFLAGVVVAHIVISAPLR